MASLIIMLAVAAAPFDPTGWTWSAPIVPPAAPGFVRLNLTAEMMAHSQPGLRDLRIVDAANNLVPHIIHIPDTKTAEHVEWKNAQLLDPVTETGVRAQVTLDFGSPMRKTLLRISMSGHEYRRWVAVEGSDDSRTWQSLREAVVFAMPSLHGADTVELPLNNYQYLRVTVYNMKGEDHAIGIAGAEAALREMIPISGLEEVPVTLTGPVRDEKDMATAVYNLDLGYANLPIERIKVAFTEPHFYMAYSLYGRNTETNDVIVATESGEKRTAMETPWLPISDGVFHRIDDNGRVSEALNVKAFRPAPYRYLQLRLHEGDNPALHLEGVSVYRRVMSLVFECAAGTEYRLLGGNPAAGMPEFALARSMPGITEKELPQVTAGPMTIKPPEPPKVPFARRYQTLIWIGLFAAATLMILLILLNLPKLRGVED